MKFALGKNFFPKPLAIEYFPMTYRGVKFFSRLKGVFSSFSFKHLPRRVTGGLISYPDIALDHALSLLALYVSLFTAFGTD